MKTKILTTLLIFASLIAKSQDMALPSTGSTYFSNAGGDAATWSNHNIRLNGWNGMGLYNPTAGGPYANQVTGVIDFRGGYIKMKGGLAVGTDAPNSNLDIRGSGGAWGLASFTKTGGTQTSHVLYGATGDWYIRSSSNGGKVILQDTEGNVGIGTATPDRKLVVNGQIGIYGSSAALVFNNAKAWDISSSATGLSFNETGIQTTMFFKAGGNVGIGTTNPLWKLQISENRGDWATVISNSSTSGYGLCINAGSSASQKIFQLGDYTGDIKFQVAGNGNVGIGTTNPGEFKLAVAGKIHATEIQVDALPWPDFVFTSTYNLRTLTEVENFITQNNHLPDVPSKAQVDEEGISLGEMNAVLLQKIEELTLYVIEQEKKSELQRKENLEMKAEIDSIKELINKPAK